MLEKVRLAVWIVIVLFMSGGPFLSQVLGYRSEWIRPWSMFSRKAINVCRVRYRIPTEDGGQVPADRLALLGFSAENPAPEGAKTLLVHSAKEAEEHGRLLCRASRIPDLRVEVDCISRQGWARKASGETNLCLSR